MSTATGSNSGYADCDEFISHRLKAARTRIKRTDLLTASLLAGVLLIGYVLVVGATYLAQRNWTFRSNAPHGRSLARYIAVQLLCMLVTACLSQFFMTLLSLVPLHASLLSTAITSVISFVLSLYWVFGEPGSSD